MIIAWVAAVLALIAVAFFANRLSGEVATPDWPEEEPLHVRDDRAHDLELTHLARLIAKSDPATIHAQLVGIVDRLLQTATVLSGPAETDPRAALPDGVRRFLEAPPLTSPDRYRSQLATVLDELEAL